MLWKWQTRHANYNNSGYDVLAISPTFPLLPPGGTPGGIPNWLSGTGNLMVDYRDTSQDFWRLMATYRPIAIMSFSRGNNNMSWEIEAGARNLSQNTWGLFNGLARPHAGGSPQDSSPFSGQGAIANNPPDPSQASNLPRRSNLPKVAIQNAVNGLPGNILAHIDNTNDVGSYVSEYMAYHVSWYRVYSQANLGANEQCLKAGHVHVGIQVPVPDAEQAVEVQMEKLIDVLP